MEEIIKDICGVSLPKLRDVVLLIERYDNLCPSEIAEKGISERLFIKKNGTPLGKSSIYRYIHAALILKLITKNKERKYIANVANPEVCNLIEIKQCYAPFLNDGEKIIFQKLLIDSSECRSSFFWLFMGRKDFKWADFVKYGNTVSISPTVIEMEIKNQKRKVRTKKYINTKTDEKIILKTYIERMAIEWGLQLWGMECSLIDEVYIDEATHVLYPLNPTLSLKFDDLLKSFLQLYKPLPNVNWSFFPIDLTTFKLAPLLRVSVKEIQDSLFLKARQKLPDYIKFSSSSKGALTFRSLSEKTDKKVLKNFIKLNNIWITHIIVHKKLWETKQWSD